MAEINRAEARAEVEQCVQTWAHSKGIDPPDFKHLLEADEIRRAMSKMELSLLARQEGYEDPLIMSSWILRDKSRLYRALSAYYGMTVPGPMREARTVDPDLLEDEDPWYEDPNISWGGYPDWGLEY